MHYILFVVIHVNSGSMLHTKEFTSLEKCEYAKHAIYEQSKRTHFPLKTAYCVAK